MYQRQYYEANKGHICKRVRINYHVKRIKRILLDDELGEDYKLSVIKTAIDESYEQYDLIDALTDKVAGIEKYLILI